MPDEIDFDSHGVRCSAWHLRAASDEWSTSRGRPCVVMGHGFGATKDAGLLPFADRFAAAGADVLVFDYRGYGTSDGMPRQDVDHRKHRQDYHAAVATARALDGVDPARVIVWGSSYSGGHVVAVGAQDPLIAAVISQGAAMDGLGALVEIIRYAGVRPLLALTVHALRDAAHAIAGRAPHLIPVVGPPGSLAAIAAPGAEMGYRVIMGPTFRNEMCARGILRIARNRPVRFARRLRCPLMLVIARSDNIAPPSAVKAVSHKARRAESITFDCGHFDIYTGEIFDKSVAAQIDFIARTLRR